MKTTKKFLSMLMAVCMLVACSMTVQAEGDVAEATVIKNYLSTDEALNDGYEPKRVGELSNMALTGTEENAESIVLPDGTAASVVSITDDVTTTGQTFASGTGDGLTSIEMANGTARKVTFQTATDIPAQKYILSVWYRTNLDKFASVYLEYMGSGVSNPLGVKRFAAALPSTDGLWKQFVMIWDASKDTYYDTEDGKTYLTDKDGNPDFAASRVEFQGCYLYLGQQKTSYKFETACGVPNANAYLEFCNPVLAPMTEDISGNFTHTETFHWRKTNGDIKTDDDTYNVDSFGSLSDLYNFLGVKENAVTVGAETSFKIASASLSAKESKAQTGQVLLASYDETTTDKQLTNIEILPFTDGIGGAVCTVSAEFAGKTIKAYFWASDGTLKPLATPATVTVEAASAGEA